MRPEHPRQQEKRAYQHVQIGYPEMVQQDEITFTWSAISTISSTPDDILNGVNSQIRLTRRLASRRLSNSAIQDENR